MQAATQTKQAFGSGSALVAAGVVGATLASFGVPQPAAAQGIGAIAFSPKAGSHGYSFKFRTSKDAERRALSECRARAKPEECDLVMTFGGHGVMCAGLATIQLKASDRPGTFTMAWSGTGSNYDAAKVASLKKCRDNTFTQELRDLCRVVVTVCNDGRVQKEP